jgi:hypothetical protein
MNYVTNEQLCFCLTQLYPGTKNGVDYVVGHMLDSNGQYQVEHATIAEWRRPDLKQPDNNEVVRLWSRFKASYATTTAAAVARDKRNDLLVKADALVNKAIDTGDAAAEQAARKYRHDLRQVPQQVGFPDTVEWPVAPT